MMKVMHKKVSLFMVLAMSLLISGIRGSLAQVASCPPPAGVPIGQLFPPTVIASSLYCTTGGPDRDHSLKGVDVLRLAGDLRHPGNEVALWHTGDWAAYHVITPRGHSWVIRICMGDPGSSAPLRPAAVYVTTRLPEHDEPISKMPPQTWVRVGLRNIDPPKRVYTFETPAGFEGKYLVLELVDGERSGQADKNLCVQWIHVQP